MTTLIVTGLSLLLYAGYLRWLARAPRPAISAQDKIIRDAAGQEGLIIAKYQASYNRENKAAAYGTGHGNTRRVFSPASFTTLKIYEY